MEISKLEIKGIKAGKPLVIAGPCSAESRAQVLQTAEQLSVGQVSIFRAGIWKPRTKPGCFEGVGEIGLQWLKEAKERTGLLTITEVATPHHVTEALKAGVDVFWIGARTTTNPFAMQELAQALAGTGIPVLVKNPVNPDLDLWIGALERLYNAGVRNFGVIHRGFSSYDRKIYRNAPMWHIPIELRRRFPELTILCDPSHIGGSRSLVAPLAQQAMDLNFDGLMIESHCSPDCALSDASQQLSPSELIEVLNSLEIRHNSEVGEDIAALRSQIDELDNQLLMLLAKRMGISREIGSYKKDHNMPVLQSGRYDQLLKSRRETGSELELDAEFVDRIMKVIHEESVRVQLTLD